MALDLPDDVVGALDAFGAGVAREGLRRVAAESLHVTLVFLGEQPDPEPVAAALATVPLEPVPLRVGAPAWLPPRRPRVLAVDLEDPEGACARLQAGVAGALSGFHAPETRPFRPHVTVARVRKGAAVDGSVPDIAEPPTFTAPSVTLYRSRPGPQGARYDALTRRDLP